MAMICRQCDARNPANSKFCNNCGASLRPITSFFCPDCGASNPNHLLYCDQCGARLGGAEIFDEQQGAPDERPDASPVPFTLPSLPEGKTGNINLGEGIPDWLETGETDDDAGDEAPDQHRAADDLPTWLLGEEQEQTFFRDSRTTDELFAPADKPAGEGKQPAEQELPDWLRGLAPEGTGPLPVSQNPAESGDDQRSLDEWLARQEEPAAAESSDWPDETGEPPTEPDLSSAHVEWPPELQGAEDDASDWLAALTGAAAESGAGEPPAAEEPTDHAEDDAAMASQMESRPIGQSPEAESSSVADDAPEMEGVPDWLLGVTPPSPPVVEPAADAIPDWLSDLTEEAAPQQASEEAAPLQEEGLPDWLTDPHPSPEEAPAAEADPAAEAAEELPDWLEEMSAPAAASEPDPALADDAASETADWLLDLDFSADLQEEASTPDWLLGLDDDEAEETITGEAFPEWLRPAAGQDAGPAAEETPGDESWLEPEEPATAESESGAAGAYDWLPEGEETPDWLLAVTAEDDQPETPTEEEVPDWLSELDAAIGELEAASQESGDDWLDLEGDTTTTSREDVEEAWTNAQRAAAEAGPDTEESEKERLPAWLAPTELSAQVDRLEFEDEEPAPPTADQTAPPEAAAPDDAEAIPDWLRELDAVSHPGTASLDEGKLPEWLRTEPEAEPHDETEAGWSAGKPAPDETEQTAASTVAGAQELNDAELEMDEILGELEGATVIPPAELPDWLEDVVVSEEFPSDLAPPDLDTVPRVLASKELPDWLEDSLPDDELAEPAAAAELPGWLQRPPLAEPELPAIELEAGEAGEWTQMLSELSSAEDTAEEISAADIPEWLQDLQPGRAGSSPRVEAETVTAGPLAGLSGVLGVEPIVAASRASEFSGRFETSKEQQEQAALLRELTRTEPHVAGRVVGRPRVVASPWLRIILSLLLLAAVVTGLVLPNLLDVSASPIYPVAPVSDVLDSAAGQPVLVVFDYTPALGGVLNRQAELLLQSLAAQGSPVVYASQSAAGLALGAAAVTAGDDLQAIRLGYIPGETVGLRRLAACLEPAGGSPDPCTAYPAELSSVAAIVLLTGERDSLVDWIEQVDAIANVPLVAGVTRALLPVAAPYYGSGQIDGLLAGEPGAAAYAAASGGAEPGAQTAAALATWLVVALLLVGNILSAIGAFAGSARSRRS